MAPPNAMSSDRVQASLISHMDMDKACKKQLNIVQTLRSAGRSEEAKELCKVIVARNPKESAAWFMLGQLYREAKQSEQAITCLDKVNETMSDDLQYHLERGAVELDLSRCNQAALSYEKALAINPRNPTAAFGLGTACIWVQDWARAIHLFRLLSKVLNTSPSVWLNLAIALNKAKEPRDCEAEAAAKKVLTLSTDEHPDAQKAALLLLTIYWEREEYREMMDMASQLLAKGVSADTRASAMTMLVRGETYLSKWAALDEHFNEAVKIAESPTHGILVHDLFFNPKAGPRIHLLCATKNIDSLVERRIQSIERPRINTRYPLRIGFLSSDFREHAVSTAFVRCFELLCRRKRISVYAYSLANPENRHDLLRARIKDASHCFVDISTFSTESIAQRIRNDEIDVLVDMNGLTANNRIAVLVHKPARVIVNYLGFPGTTGTEFHDWIIGDSTVTPEGEELYFSEKIWRLPDTYMPTDDSRPPPVAPRKSEAGLPEESFIFACFNSNRKINAEVFDAWCDILNKVPGSMLWLRACPETAQENLFKTAGERGVERKRIVFAPWCRSPAEHLARIALADLSLDTWPYNMHVTCADTLFAGVPVLTLKGRTFPGRVAESILNAAGLADLVSATKEAYIATAVRLAMDRERLNDIKKRVLWSRDNSPLFNSTTMAHSLERALVGIYEKETGVNMSADE